MSDFSVRSENVDVEQIMRQIRARIREKRGVDYTEEEIRELANVKLEKFIDPKGVRSGLLEEYRRVSKPEPPAPNFAFGEDTLYETHRGPIRWLRALFRPFLKLLFNPNPLIQALLYGLVLTLVSGVYFALIERPCMRKDWPQRAWAQLRSKTTGNT